MTRLLALLALLPAPALADSFVLVPGAFGGAWTWDAVVPLLRAEGHSVTAVELKEMIDSGKDFALIDVREPHEYEIVKIPGSTLIPKDRILSGEALAEIPQDKPVVLHCKSGARSAEALAVLHRSGFRDAVHVGGGVLAWVRQVDPSLPTY